MLIYLYSNNLSEKGGGAKSSLVIKKYLNELSNECITVSDVGVLRGLISKRKPDLVLHHNILDMFKILRICKKNKIKLIIKVNGLITCGKGTHFIENKTSFGTACLRCSIFRMLNCSIRRRPGYNFSLLERLKLSLAVPLRYFKLKIRLYCLNKADAVIAVGSTLKSILIENNVKNKIYVCPQPIDDDFLNINNDVVSNIVSNLSDCSQVVINHFNKSKKKKIILATGLHSEKGVLVFLKAFNELKREDTELYIIGKRYSYIDLSAFKPYIGKQVFLVGKIPLNYMKNFYKKATFLAHPSLLFEPFGRAWAEALLWKVPVLAFKNRGSPSDCLTHEKEAYFCDLDIGSLKKGIVEMLDNKKLREKLSFNGYKYGKKNLLASVVVKRLIEIYNNVLL